MEQCKQLEKTIKELRIANHMSQEDLAKALHVSRQTVSRWERGKNRPEIDNILLMCDLFHVPSNVLLPDELQGIGSTLISSSTQENNQLPEEDTNTQLSIVEEKDQSNFEKHELLEVLILIVVSIAGALIPILGIPLIIFGLLKIKPVGNYRMLTIIISLLCLAIAINNSYFFVNDFVRKDVDIHIEKVN